MTKWFNNENFWIDFYPFMFPEEKFKEAEEQTEKIISLVKLSKGKVLDLCCGPGRFAIQFAMRRFNVTGVDKTEFLLDKAKHEALKHKVKIKFILADMLDYISPDTYDLIINMFTSFGYFKNRDHNITVLKNVYAGLKPGGQFLIDTIGKEILAKIFQSTISTKGKDGSLWIQRHEIIDNWTRVKNEWILLKNDRVKTYHLDLCIYSAQELKDLLYDAGFSDVQLFSDFLGSEYGINANRLIALSKK